MLKSVKLLLKQNMKLAIGFITYKEHTAKYLPYFLPSLFKALEKISGYKIFCWDNSENNRSNIEFIINPVRNSSGALDPAGIILKSQSEPACAGRAGQLLVDNPVHPVGNFNFHRGKEQGGIISNGVNNYPQIKITKSEKNIGFAAAYNRMVDEAKKSGAEYFLVINPDTILEPEAIKELIEVMDKNKSLGSASPKVLKWDFAGEKKTNIIDTLGIKLKLGLRFIDLGQGEEDEGQFDKTDILGPSGAAGIYRMSAMEKITSPSAPLLTETSPLPAQAGPTPLTSPQPSPSQGEGVNEKGGSGGQYFDELMFMYKEDCDLAYRLYLAGFKAKLVPKAIIYHDRTVSSAKKGFSAFFRGRGSKSEQVKKWSFLNQHIIFLKYWKTQNWANKLAILCRAVLMFIFVLLFEQYLLGQYWELWKIKKEFPLKADPPPRPRQAKRDGLAEKIYKV